MKKVKTIHTDIFTTHPLEWELSALAELIKYHQFHSLIMVENLLFDQYYKGTSFL